MTVRFKLDDRILTSQENVFQLVSNSTQLGESDGRR